MRWLFFSSDIFIALFTDIQCSWDPDGCTRKPAIQIKHSPRKTVLFHLRALIIHSTSILIYICTFQIARRSQKQQPLAFALHYPVGSIPFVKRPWSHRQSPRGTWSASSSWLRSSSAARRRSCSSSRHPTTSEAAQSPSRSAWRCAWVASSSSAKSSTTGAAVSTRAISPEGKVQTNSVGISCFSLYDEPGGWKQWTLFNT